MSDGIVVFGASGHAKVVIDAATRQGYQVVAVFDDNPGAAGTRIMDVPVLGGRDALLQWREGQAICGAIVAIGDNAARGDIASWLTSVGIPLLSVIHPGALVARDAALGAGSVVMAGAVINPGARIGRNCIINTSASVDHDCELGDTVHLGPGAHLCGNVKVGQGALIGVGSAVIPGVTIGERAVVGAGSTIIRDVARCQTVAGSPAKEIK